LLWAEEAKACVAYLMQDRRKNTSAVGNLTQASKQMAYDGLLTKNPYRSSSTTWQQR
jgi:hypothetical protein